MSKMFLLFSHKLTNDQIIGAKNELSCDKLIYLPENLQNIWSNVSPDKYEDIKLSEIKYFLFENCQKGDFVLIQGEWGYTYNMVNFCKKLELIPVYSTTIRDSKEVLNSDGTISKTSIFKHVMYKKY